MEGSTYTRDGESEYELVYDVTEETADDTTVVLENDGDRIVTDAGTFRAEWREMTYDDRRANYAEARKESYRNGNAGRL